MKLVGGVSVVSLCVGRWYVMTCMLLVGGGCTVHVGAGSDGHIVRVCRLCWCLGMAWMSCVVGAVVDGLFMLGLVVMAVGR